MSLRHYSYMFYYTVALCLSATAVVSCDEDKRNRVNIGNENEVPSTEVHNLEVVYTEYGKTKVLLKAPLLQRYLFVAEPYSVFPEGLFVQFFDENEQLESQITADYALYKEKPVELWKAVGNVEVKNFQKKQSLVADTLYWNHQTNAIYNYSLVQIKTIDGLIIGREGFISNEQFSQYEIRSVGDSSYYYIMEQPPASDSLAPAVEPLPVIQDANTPRRLMHFTPEPLDVVTPDFKKGGVKRISVRETVSNKPQ